MNRRGVNPFAEAKLLWDYKRLLQKSARTLCLHIPLNQISIWVCSAVAKDSLLCQRTGTWNCIPKPVLAGFVTVLYRMAFRKVKYVFFENKENAREFSERNIILEDRQVVLPGAGINLENTKWNLTRTIDVSIFCISDAS